MNDIRAQDGELLRLLDATLADAAHRCGDWLVCRPGCTSCCMGEFPITELDAQRLRRGLRDLTVTDPDRAARILARAAANSGAGEDDPCPVLDPDAGTCDLYAWRPVTCRVFGPAITLDNGGIGACELCFEGATDEQIAACAVRFDPDGLEADLIAQLGPQAETTVAAAIRRYTPEHALPAPTVLGDAGRDPRGGRPE